MPAKKASKSKKSAATKRSAKKTAGKKATARKATGKKTPSRKAAGTQAVTQKTSKASQRKRASAQMMERMKRFIRSHCEDYLSDPNINSVGIGFKQVDGKIGKELALQFSVDKKVRPEALEAVTVTPIPEKISFEGVALPTDVVQRTFRPGYLVVDAEAVEKDERKQRLDTIVPGISVANVRTTAGTLGAFVLDQRGGDRVMLSNWHVFHTPAGQLGDKIVQPGPFDDNRVDQNVVGTLRRSHLGPAGDCAIASVESREMGVSILGLDTTVRRIGKAELGDKVAKSGRTTGVTFGVVTRVEVITKMDYGDGVRESIGGFEIGVDADRKPKDGEISKGGDSGSCWMAVSAQKTTDIMLGLHFAGDAEDSDAEFALACNATSVFEKLEIQPLGDGDAALVEVATTVREDLRTGFKQDFLRFPIADVKFTDSIKTDLATFDDSREIHYTHFSVWLSKSRKFPRLVAWNIDGGNIKKIDRAGIPFVKDERGGLQQFQIGDELYADNPLDRGHVARRADLCWGPMTEARQANRDSFFFSNITPQHQRFNQGQRKGLWGRLEDAVFEDVSVAELKVSLMGGPILRPKDPLFEDVRIPVEFWKLVAYTDDADGDNKVRAFILTQRNLIKDLVESESLELNEFHVFQVPLTRIEADTGIRFPKALKALDTMPPKPEGLGPNVRLVEDESDLFS